MISRFLILTLLILSSLGSRAQLTTDLQNDVRKWSKQRQFVPFGIRKNPRALAQHLCANAKSDQQKVVIISAWICRKIRYDMRGYRDRRWISYSNQKVLKKRKALCGEYSELFREMCDAVGVSCEIVNGFAPGWDYLPGDTVYRSDHTWSLVEMDGYWFLADLTWGAGTLKKRKQYIARFLNRVLGFPYIPKFKYKHVLNTEWLFVDPRTMIFTHYPNMKHFQMLSTPVPLEVFEAGNEVINTYLFNENIQPDSLVRNANYLGLSKLHKWEAEARMSIHQNPRNHVDAMICKLNILDSLFRASYDSKKQLIETDQKSLIEILELSEEADSIADLAIEDHKTEYDFYKTRSSNWKNDLRRNDRDYAKRIRDRISENRKQLRAMKRLEIKNRASARYTNSRIGKVKYDRIFRVNRAKDDSKLTLNQKGFLIKFDSTLKELKVSSKSIDSLWSSIPEETQQAFSERATKSLVIHELNKRDMSLALYDQSRSNYLIHYDSMLINKPWFPARFDRADSINQSSVDSLLSWLANNQELALRLSKTYYKQSKDALKFIESVKKTNSRQFGEDSVYAVVVTKYTEDFLSFREQALTYLKLSHALNRSLKKEMRVLKKTLRDLNSDMVFEGSRHINYQTYRKHVRTAEVRRLKILQKRIRNIGKAAERSIE